MVLYIFLFDFVHLILFDIDAVCEAKYKTFLHTVFNILCRITISVCYIACASLQSWQDV